MPGRGRNDAGGQHICERVHHDRNAGTGCGDPGQERSRGTLSGGAGNGVHADDRRPGRQAGRRPGRKSDGGRWHAIAEAGEDDRGRRVGQTSDVRRVRGRPADSQARRLLDRPRRGRGRPAGDRDPAGGGADYANHPDGRRRNARGTRAGYADDGGAGRHAPPGRRPRHADDDAGRPPSPGHADECRHRGRAEGPYGRRRRRPTRGRHDRPTKQFVPSLHGARGRHRRCCCQRLAAGRVQDTPSEARHARTQPESAGPAGHVHQDRDGRNRPGFTAAAAAAAVAAASHRRRRRRRRRQVRKRDLHSFPFSRAI